MLMSEIERDNQAIARISGKPDGDSNDERLLFKLIYTNLYNNPGSRYRFCFNIPITECGVPTQILRIQDFRDLYIQFVMNRCFMEREEAIELMSLIDTPVRTNTLCLDVAKMRGNKLIAGLESNRGRHYYSSDSYEERKGFAKSLFNDMVKEIEVSKIADFVVVNHVSKNANGVGSPESIRQELTVEAFANVID